VSTHSHRHAPTSHEHDEPAVVGHGHPAERGHPAEHGDHHHDGGDHAAIFRRKFWISLLLTLPAVVYSEMFQHLLGYTAPSVPGDRWIAPLFGTAVFLYGGPVFLRGGWSELKARKPGMMLLISMGLLVAFGASVLTEIGWINVDLWWELATLVTIMLLGHWLEMRAVGQAQGALAALAELLPDEAERLDEAGEPRVVPLSDLALGDVVLVRAGGRVPADGVIRDGTAELDESMITGESRPATRGEGDRVVAGTVSTDASIRVEITALGADTALAGIQRLVEDAQASQSRAQFLADRFAALLFYVALLSGVATFVVWMLLGDPDAAIERTVTVLVIACPHALGLAIPLTVAVSTSISARAGILIKDRMALERMRTIDAVLFDKTGTLTLGQHQVTDLAANGVSDAELLGLAAAVEAESEHPLARAIVARAQVVGPRPTATGVHYLTGRGVEATVDGHQVAVGGPSLLRLRDLAESDLLSSQTSAWRARGAAVLHVVRDGEVIGAFALEDAVRAESHEAIAELRRFGVRSVMITGDARQVADAVARELGIDEVFAEVLPADKDSKVAELQDRGLRVAMVGDGVNDAPALARADVGLAIGAGTDVAIESADVVLASSDPRSVIGVIRLSRASYRKMVQNLAWGAGYNLVAIPLAAGVFAFAGLTLSPAVGAIFMSVSTIVVALNAQLLRRLQLRPTEAVRVDASTTRATSVHQPRV
jgi:Cu2+-exporting ATPase